MALLTDMGQPLGQAAGNWIEAGGVRASCCAASGPAASEDLRELSLQLAGWMIALGGKAETLEDGYAMAETALDDGSALRVFLEMVEAQGGDVSVFDDLKGFHKPGATQVLEAWESGYIAAMDTTAAWLGGAAARRGPREGRRAGGSACRDSLPCTARVAGGEGPAAGHALCDRRENAGGAGRVVQSGDHDSHRAAPEPVPLVSRIFTREMAEEYLTQCCKVVGNQLAVGGQWSSVANVHCTNCLLRFADSGRTMSYACSS